jgi:hypothetical protein
MPDEELMQILEKQRGKGRDDYLVRAIQHENKNKKTDGRKDTEADWGRKEYRGQRKDGTMWEKIVKWAFQRGKILL